MDSMGLLVALHFLFGFAVGCVSTYAFLCWKFFREEL